MSRSRPLVELGDPSLEHDVVAGDLLGQHRQVRFDGRLHAGVLVLGVGDEEGPGACTAGEVGTGRAVGGIERPASDCHGEQLSADALVDVAVQVEGPAGFLGSGVCS